MPVAWRHGPYRFFFWSRENSEPPHVHVERERHKAKFWLDPVRLAQSGGFRSRELVRLQELIEENQRRLFESWDEYFNE